MTSLVKLIDVVKSYRVANSETLVLNHISLEISKTEFVGIMGRSGSGKSTLLNLIGFLDKQFDGEYFFEGKNIHEFSDDALSKLRNQNVGFVFQNFSLIENQTIAQNVALPLSYAGKIDYTKVKESLSLVELSGFENRSVRLLSGGQRQRVAIARAIINSPKFIIAVEPTGSLASKTSRNIMQLLKKLNQAGTTIILVTHDKNLINYCDRSIRLEDGEVID
ncbi:ABC transporter ATP-binding protein [Enterococcus faecalis]